MGMWRIYSNPDPHVKKNTQNKENDPFSSPHFPGKRIPQ
jgi:hypothetical protein